MNRKVFLHYRHYTRSASPPRLCQLFLTEPLDRLSLNLRIVTETGEASARLSLCETKLAGVLHIAA